jgi:hypothetical protein
MPLIKYAGLQMPNTNLAGIIKRSKPWTQEDFDLNTPANWNGLAFDPDGSLLGASYIGITSWKDGVLTLHITEDGIVYPTSSGGTTISGVGLGFEETVKPGSDAVYKCIIPYAITFAVNCSGSYFYNHTNPSATVVISIQKNDVQFATCSVNTSGVGTFSSALTVCAVGSKISFVFPAQDSTWAGIAITVKGTRSL